MPIPAGVIVGWPSTAGSIPAGWDRVTSLDGRYLKGVPDGVTDPGSTGGATSHSHTPSAHDHGIGSHTHGDGTNTGPTDTLSIDDSGSGATQASGVHTHDVTINASTDDTSSASPSTDSVDNDPANEEVVWIESDGTPEGFPDGVVTWFNDTSLPSGWTQHATGNGRCLKGAPAAGNGGGTGGTDTHTHDGSHTHTFSHDHPATAQNDQNPVQSPFGGPNAHAASPHSHSVSLGSGGGTSGSANLAFSTDSHQPPFHTLALAENTSSGDLLTPGVITAWLGTLASIPDGWVLCDGNNGTPDLTGVYVKNATTLATDVGTTGGAADHSHTGSNHTHAFSSHTHTISYVSGAAQEAGTTDGDSAASTSHDHSNHLSASSSGTSGTAAPAAPTEDHEPEHTEVAFIQLQQIILIDVTGSGGLILGGLADVEIEQDSAVQVPSNIVVEWDFDNDGNFDEDEEDITERVLALETRTGRDWPSLLTGKASPGILRATLLNDDDRFSPFNTASPLNSGNNSLTTGRKLRVRTVESGEPDPTSGVFPQVAAANSSQSNTNQTTHTIDLPAGIETGDLLIVVISWRNDTTISFPAGWTKFLESTGENPTQAWAWRKADGGEGASITVTAASGRQAAQSFRITGAADPMSLPPEGEIVNSIGTANPDAPELVPSWGNRDVLWLVGCSSHSSDDVTAAPANYTDLIYNESAASGSGTAGLGTARRELTATSENPGTFTIEASQDVPLSTVAIPKVLAEPVLDPVLLARDRFNRSNGALGSTENGLTWSEPLADDFTVSANEAAATGEGDEHIAVVDVGTADYYAQVKLAEVGAETTGRTGSVLGLVYRYQDSTDYSLAVLDVDAGQVQLIDVVAGTPSTVATEMAEVYDGMTLGVLLSGAEVTLHLEGVPLLSDTAIQTDETQVGIYAEWGTGQPAPALDDFHVWDSLPAEVEGILWTGDVSDLVPDVVPGPRKLAMLSGAGWLSRPAGQKVSPPSTVTGRSTGLLVGNTLAMTSLLNPPVPLDEGDVTTGPFGMSKIEAIEALRRFEETELGFLFETQEGPIGYDSRTARDGASSQMTLTDAAGGQFGYHRITPLTRRREVINRVLAEVAPTAVPPLPPTTSSTHTLSSLGDIEVSLPAARSPGDLVIILLAVAVNTVNGTINIVVPDGYTELGTVGDNGTDATVAALRVIDGTESSPVTFGVLDPGGTDGVVASQAVHIENWFGTRQGGVQASAVETFFSGATQQEVPVLPSWGHLATTFVVGRMAPQGSTADNVAPLGYTNAVFTENADGNGVVVHSAHRVGINAGIEQPTAFGDDPGGILQTHVTIAVRGPNLNQDGEPSDDRVVVQIDDTDSQDEHNVIRTHPNPAVLFADEADAQTYGELVLARYANDRPIVAVSFWATKNAAYRAQAIRRRVSDRITLVANNRAGLGINGDFFIESITHRWSQGRTLWEVTWELSPV